MGGKSEIINYGKMEELHSNGCEYVSQIRVAVKNIEERMAILRGGNFTGERGVAYRQALIAISIGLNELSRSTEKTSIFMDTKLNVKKLDSNTQALDAARNKSNYLTLRK